MNLDDYRQQIDRADDALLRAFCDRMEIAAKIAACKKEQDLPVLDSARERQKLKAIAEKAGPEMEDYATVLYALLFELSRAYQGHLLDKTTELTRQITAAIEETFGRSDTYVVLVPEGDTATQQKLSDALHAIPEVTGILSYVDNAGASIPPEFVPGDTLGLLVSGGYTRLVLTVDADTAGDGAFALVERVRATGPQ